MGSAERTFEVIQGGPDGGATETYIATGVVDENGRAILRKAGAGTTSGDGGGSEMSFKFTLPQRVRMVEIGLSLLVGACALAFWFIMDRIDGRFDRVDEPLRTLTSNVSAETATLKDVNDKLSDLGVRLGAKNGDQPETSAATGEARTVHRGTGSGSKPNG